MLDHPIMQVANVRASVQDPSGLENVRVFTEQLGRNDAGLVLLLLEVWIGKEEE